jgi:hypothetical protein
MWNEQTTASKSGKPKIYSVKNILGIVTVCSYNAGFHTIRVFYPNAENK